MPKKKDELGIADKGEEKETPPESEPETTPEPETKEEVFTYSKTERDNYVNAEKATLGRELKNALDVNVTLKRTMNGQGTRITDLESTIQTIRGAERERELKTAEGDTEVISAIKLRHKNEDAALQLSKERSDFAQERAQHQADLDDLAKTKATNIAGDLAKESGLTADLLLQIGSDQDKDGRTVYNLERMKNVASKSPKVEGEEESEEETASAPVKGIRAKASSTGRAASGLRTFADFEKAYVEGQIGREEFAKAIKRFNIQI